MSHVAWDWGPGCSRLLASQTPRPPHLYSFPEPCAWPQATCCEQDKVPALRDFMFLFTGPIRHQPHCGYLSHMSSSLTVISASSSRIPSLRQRTQNPWSLEPSLGSLLLPGRPSLSTSSLGLLSLPFHCPANPWEVTSPSLARFQCSCPTLAPGSWVLPGSPYPAGPARAPGVRLPTLVVIDLTEPWKPREKRSPSASHRP